MSQENARPVGVTLLSWFHILAGAAAVAGVLVAGYRAGRFAQGLPVEVLAAAAAVAVPGVAAGVGMLRGRTWSWWLGSSVYLVAACLFGGSALVGKPLHASLPLPGWLGSREVLAASVVALAVYGYFLARGARSFFGLAGLAGWKPVAVQALVAVAVTLVAVSGPGWVSSESDASISKRLQKIGARGGADDEEAAFLLDRLESGTDEQRILAAYALGKSRRASVIFPLMDAAREDRDESVRINAIASIVYLGGTGVEETVLELLDDESAEVQAAALRGVASAGYAVSVDRVVPLLTDGGTPVRPVAADFLGNLGDPAAVPALQRAASDAEKEVRTRVAFALGKLGDARAVTTLGEMLKDDEWEVRANAAQSLGMLGDRSARSVLTRALNDPNGYVKDAARAALDKLR